MGRNRTGLDQAHSDVLVANLLTKCLGKTLEAGFGGSIDALTGRLVFTADRSDKYKMTTALLLHSLNGLSGGGKAPRQIGFDNVSSFVLIQFGLVATECQYASLLSGKQRHGRAANAGGTAGYENPPALKVDSVVHAVAPK